MAFAVLNAQMQACGEGRHADAYAEPGRATFVGGRTISPGTRYCRSCSVVLPWLYIAAPDLLTFKEHCRARGVPAQMWRWLSQENRLHGLGDAEIIIVTAPHSPPFPTGFMDTLAWMESTARVVIRRPNP